MPERYIAFDVETPNYANDRMSAIGITVVENGTIVDEFATLVNPESRFDYFNIQLTGITPEMAAGAPTFLELWPTIGPILDSGLLIAHNASFDMSVLAKCLRAYGICWRPCADYACTVQMGRRCYPQLPNHKLNTLCDYLNIPLDHHQAGSDSRACAELLIRYLKQGMDVGKFRRSYDLLHCRTLKYGMKKTEWRECTDNVHRNALEESQKKEHLIEYLKCKYRPEAIILYGSYADGTNQADSDFDCLIVSTRTGCSHDTSTVDGIVLDAFIYTPEEVSGDMDYDGFLQIHDGIIVLDQNGIAASLQQNVRTYINSLPQKSIGDIQSNMAWCEKMLHRTERADPEGFYRWHWLLTDSLEIYCDIRGKRYFGPKKSLRMMQSEDPTAYRLYADALSVLDRRKTEAWITYLKRLCDQNISSEQENPYGI